MKQSTYDDPPPQYGASGSGYSVPPFQHQVVTPPPPPIGIQNTVYVLPAVLRDNPAQVVCPQCKAAVLTQLQYESGIAAWLIAGGLCLFGYLFH